MARATAGAWSESEKCSMTVLSTCPPLSVAWSRAAASPGANSTPSGSPASPTLQGHRSFPCRSIPAAAG